MPVPYSLDLDLPVPEVTPGPEWANKLNSALTAVASSLHGGDLFVPSRSSLRKWRALRGEVEAGQALGRINVVGDSRTFGAGLTSGVSLPKYAHSLTSRLQARLDATRGPGGTGMVWANPDVLAEPTFDDRWVFSESVTAGTLGPFRDCSLMIPVGQTVEFTATCDTFVIYSLPGGGGTPTVSVDGVDVGTIRNTSTGTTGSWSIPSEYNGRQVVSIVDAGDLDEHTVKIAPTSGSTLVLLAIEARINTPGTWQVSNSGVNGKSLGASGFTSTNNDETNGFYGRPVLADLPQAHMNVLFLGINDVQSSQPLSHFVEAATNYVQRVRDSGANSQGTPYADGDALLVVGPDYSSAGAAFDDYRDGFYQVAEAEDVALLDLSARWGPYAESSLLGMFYDEGSIVIHPSNRGSQDIADALHWALFEN